MKFPTISEWGHLQIIDDISDDRKNLTFCEASELIKVVQRLPKFKNNYKQVLEIRHNELKTKNVVGVIQTENCALEILPKIDVYESGDVCKRNMKIRNKLIHMISIAYDLKLYEMPQTNLGSQNFTLLEQIIEIFANNLLDAVRMSLSKNYIHYEDDLPNLRGTLNITRQFTKLAVNPARMACKFDEFSIDIPINQILKSTVTFLTNISRKLSNQHLLRKLSIVFTEVSDIPVANLDWEIVFNRTNERWRNLVMFSKFLLEREFQTTTLGDITGYPFLFEMPRLFEKYVGNLVKIAAKKLNLKVELNQKKIGLTNIYNTSDTYKVRPDILIWSKDKVVQIIDTKWKQISLYNTEEYSDTHKRVSDKDIYQMITYSEFFDSPRVTLFYPHSKGIGEIDEGILKTYRIESKNSANTTNESDKFLEIFSIDLAKNTDKIECIVDLLGLR